MRRHYIVAFIVFLRALLTASIGNSQTGYFHQLSLDLCLHSIPVGSLRVSIWPAQPRRANTLFSRV